MKVHLVDGTYELFRHFFGAPPHRTAAGHEVAAVRGVVSSVLQLLGEGATHVGVATDHVIESFRNDLWPGYKTGEGVDPDLWSQAWPLEAALSALGVVVWPMVELEADDALASGAAVAADDPAVEQVIICTPDKDLGQCVRGTRVVQLDRRKDVVIDEGGVAAKFGVGPASIPDAITSIGCRYRQRNFASGYTRSSSSAYRAVPRLLSQYRCFPRRLRYRGGGANWNDADWDEVRRELGIGAPGEDGPGTDAPGTGAPGTEVPGAEPISRDIAAVDRSGD